MLAILDIVGGNSMWHLIIKIFIKLCFLEKRRFNGAWCLAVHFLLPYRYTHTINLGYVIINFCIVYCFLWAHIDNHEQMPWGNRITCFNYKRYNILFVHNRWWNTVLFSNLDSIIGCLGYVSGRTRQHSGRIPHPALTALQQVTLKMTYRLNISLKIVLVSVTLDDFIHRSLLWINYWVSLNLP